MSYENSHSRQSSSSQSHSANCYNDNCLNAEDDSFTVSRNNSKNPSSFDKLNSVFCEDCEHFFNLKLAEAEQSILGKDAFINLLKEQLIQLKDRNVRSINDAQDVNCKYGIAKQEVICLRQICKKYDDELQKLRAERETKVDQDAVKLKEEAESWKKQYEELLTKIQNTEAEEADACEKQNWCTAMHNEVSTVISLLKENSQTVVSSLEKQNRKLEALVEKLRNDLDASSHRQEELEKELISRKSSVADASVQADCDCDVKKIQQQNKKLQNELDVITKKYQTQKEQMEFKKQETEQVAKSEYDALACNVCDLVTYINSAKEAAIVTNKALRKQLQSCASPDVSQYLSNVTASLVSVEMITNNTAYFTSQGTIAISVYRSTVNDLERINEVNADMKQKLQQITLNQSIAELENEIETLKNELKQKTILIDDLNKKLTQNTVDEDVIKGTWEQNKCLVNDCKRMRGEIKHINSELNAKNNTVKSQLEEISKLNEIAECNKQTCIKLKKQVDSFETKGKNSNCADQEIKGLKSKLETYKNEADTLRNEYQSMKTSFDNVTKEKDTLNERLQNALTNINDLKKSLDKSLAQTETLETRNKDLAKEIDHLSKNKFEKVKSDIKDFKKKFDSLQAENESLRKNFDKEKQNSESLQKAIDSLNFFYDNEITARNQRCNELKMEQDRFKETLQQSLEKLQQSNKLLQQKLHLLENENQNLHKKLSEQYEEINRLNAKLLHGNEIESENYVNRENDEMSSAVCVIQQILEGKRDVNKPGIECKECNTSDLQKTMLHRVNSIEHEINSLQLDTKCNSLPDLDKIDSTQESATNINVLFTNPDNSANSKFIRKSSSLDCIPCKPSKEIALEKTIDCRSRWQKHLETIHKLRGELNDIVEKLDLRKQERESSPTKNVTCYKQIIDSLQRQVNELQVKTAQESSKCYGLEAELKGLRGEMVAKSDMAQEISILRNELFNKKGDRFEETDEDKKRKEAESLAAQQKVKQDYLKNRQNLLTDLAVVQNALQEKTQEDNKLKKRCDQLVKDVTLNQARRKKLRAMTSRTQQSTSGKRSPTMKVIIQPLPFGQQTDSCSCSTPLPCSCQSFNTNNTSPVFVNVRAKMKTVVEKHHLKSDSEADTPLSIEEEEFEGKYILK